MIKILHAMDGRAIAVNLSMLEYAIDLEDKTKISFESVDFEVKESLREIFADPAEELSFSKYKSLKKMYNDMLIELVKKSADECSKE